MAVGVGCGRWVDRRVGRCVDRLGRHWQPNGRSVGSCVGCHGDGGLVVCLSVRLAVRCGSRKSFGGQSLIRKVLLRTHPRTCTISIICAHVLNVQLAND